MTTDASEQNNTGPLGGPILKYKEELNAYCLRVNCRPYIFTSFIVLPFFSSCGNDRILGDRVGFWYNRYYVRQLLRSGSANGKGELAGGGVLGLENMRLSLCQGRSSQLLLTASDFNTDIHTEAQNNWLIQQDQDQGHRKRQGQDQDDRPRHNSCDKHSTRPLSQCWQFDMWNLFQSPVTTHRQQPMSPIVWHINKHNY